MKSYRICINGLPSLMGGGQTYMVELLRHLSRLDSSNVYTVIVPALRQGLLPELSPNFRILPVPDLAARAGFRVLYEQFVLPWVLLRGRHDLLYSPGGTDPLWKPCRSVLCVQSTLALNHPSYSPTFWRHFSLKALLASACRSSARIIVPSEQAGREVSEALGVDGNRVTPVHHGVTPDSGGDGDSLPPAVKVPYILSVSSFYRYKNYARLVEAFGLLREKVSQEYQLVLVGYPVERDVHEAVNRQIASLGLRDHCLILPGVPYDSLSALYRHASIYVFPSLCESFGLTPLEAMAFGVPTLVSNISAMPEICANGALFFDPYDSADLADKAVAVLQTSSLREDLTKRGRERARRFTWEACARKTLNVFLEVMSRGR